jgi:ATP-dependent protease ClpP protease subunit
MIEKMLSDIRVSDSAAEAVIDIVGVIGVPEQAQFDQAGERVATYARFADALTAVAAVQAPRVVVNIRSTGGDVNDALLIFDALRGLGAQVVTRCYGYVASAATVIAQAASPGCREISSNALYLIHCSESAAEGNARSLSQAKELLDRTDERIAAIYASRSGLPASGFAALMNENGGKGRWLTPDETIAAGLADRIVPSPADNSVDERSCGGGDIGALCRLFGMTLPPDAAGEERRESFAERFLRRAGVVSKILGRLFPAEPEGEPEAELPKQGTCGGGAVSDKASVVPPSDSVPRAPWGAGQDEAFPTQTEAVEDPCPDDYRPSPNEEAYRQDALNMRMRG